MRLYEPTERGLQEWHEWVASRPPVVRAIAGRLNNFTLYQLKSTGQYVLPIAFAENGTVRVRIVPSHVGAVGEWILGIEVFGIDPDDIEPATEWPLYDEGFRLIPTGDDWELIWLTPDKTDTAKENR